MSVWTRLFGQSKSSQPKSKSRLGLESLEMREVPAIVFVGGWGASMYQYAHTDPAPDALPQSPVVDLTFNPNIEVVTPSVTDLVLDPFNPNRVADGRSSAAADYSAIAFVGGWGSSSPATGDSLPTEQLSMNYAKVRFDTAPVNDSLTVPEPRPEPVVVEYLILGTSIPTSDDSAGSGQDVLVGGPSADTTAADDVWVDGKVITGENYDSAAIASSGYIRIKKLNSGG